MVKDESEIFITLAFAELVDPSDHCPVGDAKYGLKSNSWSGSHCLF